MADGMEILRRDFLIDDLRAITAEAVVHCILPAPMAKGQKVDKIT
jgi:hypothetical protein